MKRVRDACSRFVAIFLDFFDTIAARSRELGLCNSIPLYMSLYHVRSIYFPAILSELFRSISFPLSLPVAPSFIFLSPCHRSHQGIEISWILRTAVRIHDSTHRNSLEASRDPNDFTLFSEQTDQFEGKVVRDAQKLQVTKRNSAVEQLRVISRQ